MDKILHGRLWQDEKSKHLKYQGIHSLSFSIRPSPSYPISPVLLDHLNQALGGALRRGILGPIRVHPRLDPHIGARIQ